MQSKDKIALLLAQGLSGSNVASMVGCTPAYISQLLKDESFKEKVYALRETEVPKKTDDELLATKYESMEHRLLGAMEASLENADLRDITNALKVVAERQNAREKRRIPANTANNTTNIQVVQIALPHQVIPTLTLNSKNEVVAIDNKPMAPMTSHSVAKLFQDIQAKKEIPHESITASQAPTAIPADF